MSHSPECVELSAKYIRETKAAVLVSNDYSTQWIPKSQLVAFREWVHDKGEPINLTCSAWFAKQNHMI